MGVAGLIDVSASSRTRQLLDYLVKLPVKLRNRLSLDAWQKSFYEYLSERRGHSTPSHRIVLVQCVEDLYYFGLFGQIASSLRERNPIRVEQFVFHSLNLGESKSFWVFVKSRLIDNALHNRKWVRLYSSFCDNVGYRSTSFRPIGDVIDLYRAWICWRNLHDRQALIELAIDGVAVGDLVNDSFLRFKPAATVALKDVYLLALIWQAYRDFRRARDYFSRAGPAIFFTSYSTYIQHGIAARVALRCGIQVFSFGNYQEFSKELSVEDWLHTKNPDNYASDFAKADRSQDKLALAEAALSARIAGAIDGATAYMKRSAYAESRDPVPDVRGAPVVFLHDFYDSPHVYRQVVFPDFWEWVCFTIDTLKAANIRFFLKPHPNQVVLNDDVLAELKHRYPEISLISSKITNKQLVEAGLTCAVTVYGTVAHEMAYLGVPTIACARHPHVSFDFCRTARSREEYANALRNCGKMDVDKAQLRQQSLIFYYMHNLNVGDEQKSLRDIIAKFRLDCSTLDETNMYLVESLKEISRLPGYEAYLSKWSLGLGEGAQREGSG